MPSTDAKQLWLQSHGKPKSYSYFMTGPNMGPGWDWDQAIAGSYTPIEVDDFLAQGKGHYDAGKAKSKAKKVAGDPLTPSTGPSTQCAKTAVKVISTWIAEAVDNAQSWYTHIGAQVHKGQTLGSFDDVASFRKAAKTHLAAAIDELGDQADEVAGLEVLIELMDDVERARLSAIDVQRVAQGWLDDDVSNAVLGLDALKGKANSVHDYTLGKAAPLFDQYDDPVGLLTKIKANADDVVLQNQQISVGRTWQKIAVQQSDEWNDLAFVPTATADAPFTVANQVQLRIELIGEIDGQGLLAADPIIAGQKRLDRLAQMWQNQVNPFDDEEVSLAIAQSGLDLMGKETVGALRDAVEKNLVAYTELLDNYADDSWWVTSQTSGLEGDLTHSPIEFWANKFGNDSAARILGESEELNALLQSLAKNGAASALSGDVTFIIDEVIDAANEAVQTLQVVLGNVKSKLPGLTATVDEVLDALDPSFKASILEAGTDDLNDLLGVQLEEVGENKSLLYYMTKKQKQDFILLPKEVFDNVDYAIKYKGDTLTGKGLTTAKTKLAAKKGKQAVQTPAAQSASAPKTLIDTITGQTEQYTVPPGSKKWWGDAMSDAQTNFLGQEMSNNTNLLKAWVDGGASELSSAGKLTKGQASQVISQVKGGKTTWTADEIKKAMNYGQPIKVQAMDDVVKAVVTNVIDPDASDIAAAVTAVEQGGAVAGTVTKTSTAAADHINWDAPHTFSYVGDGKGKWGGAHRKWQFTDEAGDDWMLKHGATFRADGELAAHKIGNAVGFDVAEARVSTQTIGGSRETGFMQKLYRKQDIKGELADSLRGGSFAGVDDDIIRQVQEHQVLDWLIGNQDGHAQNFLIMKDGRVIGIDKGQAFKFMGTDSLSTTYKPADNFGEIVYNRMWQEYSRGVIDLDLDSIDSVLRRIEALSDQDYRALIRKYADGRFAAGARSGALGQTSANSADELVELAVNRKRNIRRDFTRFYKDNAEERGITWNPAWQEEELQLVAAKKVGKTIKAGDILTPIDEDFVFGLDRAGTAGKSIYVGGSDVERGQVLFDVVLDSNGDEVLRGTVVLRPDADARLLKVFAEEGGDGLSQAGRTGGPVVKATPGNVGLSQNMGTETVKGAKTVNYHISQGDFAPNQAQINTVQGFLDQAEGADVKFAHITNVNSIADDVLQGKVDELAELLDGPELDAAIEVFVSEQAADATLLKTMQTYELHWQEIVEEGAKGNLAKKVGKVPDFPTTGHYEKVREDALRRARSFSSSVKVAEHIEVVEPDKLFTSIAYKTNRTSTIKVGSGTRNAVLEGEDIIKGNAYFANTDEGVEIIYREISGSAPTHQGWMELSLKTDTGKVTQADIETMYRTLTRNIGLKADLATSQDMELTYWRVVTGTYRNSVEGASQNSKYFKAIQDVDIRVRALGPNPNPKDEIDAIRGAWRAQFGRQIDDADFLPIHDHALSRTADEIGWGYFERPELGDLSIDLQGKVVSHSTTYGDGRVRAELIEGATGDSMLSQARRQQYGFKASAKSAIQDLEGGGASGLFTRIKRDTNVSANEIIMNPSRVHRKLGNYNAEGDTYGRLRDRTSRNTLSSKRWATQANSTNETMIRDGVSWMDDVEIAFYGTKTEADLAVRTLADRGITSIRGVPVNERLVSVPNPGAYTHKFFQERVGRQGFAARLRRSVDDILEKGRAVTQAAKDDAIAVVSRLKIRTLKLEGKLADAKELGKKLSAGRPAQVYVQKPGSNPTTLALRYHNNENAVTVSLAHFTDSGAIGFVSAAEPGTVGSLELGMKQLGITNWSKTVETKFKFRRRQFTGDGIVIDLSPYGIDLKSMSQYQRPQVLREFVQALITNTLDEFSLKWAGIAA